jgi:hypothetical protein
MASRLSDRFAVKTLGCSLILLFAGCQSARQPTTYISNLGLNNRPTVENFDFCDSAGCRSISGLGFSPREWELVENLFIPHPETPAEERERINLAVGLIETLVGEKNDTLGDAPKNMRHLGTGKQIDCIAEAANTTVALLLLKQEGLLRHHRIGFPQHRGFVQLRLPHNAASVYELESGDHYVIDSWFFAGGEPAVSLPVAEWRSGYDPHEDPSYQAPTLPQNLYTD